MSHVSKYNNNGIFIDNGYESLEREQQERSRLHSLSNVALIEALTECERALRQLDDADNSQADRFMSLEWLKGLIQAEQRQRTEEHDAMGG